MEGQDDSDEAAFLDFSPKGQLTYSITTPRSQQEIHLVYEIVGDEIVTDQPSKPRLERSRYYFEDPNTLVIEFDGLRTWFARVSAGSAV